VFVFKNHCNPMNLPEDLARDLQVPSPLLLSLGLKILHTAREQLGGASLDL